ncbi:restriction endonuclease [Candidatus Saccharibacteria bacterium]|nr:restriction endonuclease [Candidatus Saccharibacteria bacterium]
MSTEFRSPDIPNAPLIVDAVYKADASSAGGFDCLPELLGCGNRGGFRRVGSAAKGYKFVVLYSSLGDPDWPDSIDYYNGMVTYYGDNKNAGADLHGTALGGNQFLRDIFDALHQQQYEKIPPVFLFTKGANGRDVIFRGLLIPGKAGVTSTEDLVAVWKMKKGQRFQNYRAIFTVLNEPVVTREWIRDLHDENTESVNAPKHWLKWRLGQKVPPPLTAERTVDNRTKEEQLPQEPAGLEILNRIHGAFTDDSYGFEKCAAELVKLMDKNVASYDLTRRTRDGGRDATGEYKIGLEDNSIKVEFAIEAKCYSIRSSVGVRETSRLISRLRHRQVGFLVTTSYVNDQAYKEIIEDGHPVVIISGGDIVRILEGAGYNDTKSVEKWLRSLKED